MNFTDFNQGRNFAARQADAAIGEWESFSNGLQRKLNSAQTEIVKLAAREAGRDAQQRALREALAKIDPAHPLLKNLPQIGAEAMIESCAKRGYSYNLDTQTLRKL